MYKRGTRQYIVTDGSQIHVTPPLTSLIMIEMVTRMMLVSKNMTMMMLMMTMVTRILFRTLMRLGNNLGAFFGITQFVAISLFSFCTREGVLAALMDV